MTERTPHLQIDDLAVEGTHTLVPAGDVDVLTAPELKAAVRVACLEGATAIVLDLRRVAFMDSSGLKAVLWAHALCGQHGLELTIVPGPAKVHSLFELTGLADHLPFRADAAHAQAADDAILPKLFTPESEA